MLFIMNSGYHAAANVALRQIKIDTKLGTLASLVFESQAKFCIDSYCMVFSDIVTMSTWDSILSAVTLEYHAADTWYDIPPSHIILTPGQSGLELSSKCWALLYRQSSLRDFDGNTISKLCILAVDIYRVKPTCYCTQGCCCCLVVGIFVFGCVLQTFGTASFCCV